MATFLSEKTAILASGALLLALCGEAAAQGLNAGGSRGISLGGSRNGPVGVGASIGGSRGVSADVGASVGRGSLATAGADASVGGSRGINARSDNTVAGRSGLVDSNTTASVGGARGLNATNGTNVGGRTVASASTRVTLGTILGLGGTGTGGTVSPGAAGTGNRLGGVGSVNGLGSPDFNGVQGLSNMTNAKKTAIMKKRCIDVLANSEGYDSGLVALCAALRG
ncbi:MAG: hypothetical protein ABWZ57_01080 [Mesorhizobium sp.]